VLGVALGAINGVRVGLSPFLPFSSAALDEILGAPSGWCRDEVARRDAHRRALATVRQDRTGRRR
jgi:hypothetical protein